MTYSSQRPSGLEGGSPVGTTPVAPVSVSSTLDSTPSPLAPLAPLVVEKKRTSALSLMLGVAVVVAIGGVAFAAGRLTAPVSAATAGTGGGRGGFGGGNGFTPGASGAPGGAGFAGGGGLGAAELTLTGTVESVSPTAITLKTAAGATVDIPIDATTTYHGQAAATSGDVKAGTQVEVQLNGAAGFGGRGGGQGGAGGGGAGGTGGASPSAPPPVGAPGAVPASPGTAGGTATTRGTGAGGGRTLGPARDITIVTP